MGTTELEAKQKENTDHIKDVRDAFEKLKNNFDFILKIFGAIVTLGTILWAIAMFVGRTNNTAENLHKELSLLEKHFDNKLKEQADSITYHKSLSDFVINNKIDQLNNKIDQQNLKIQTLNEKCERYQFLTERWINGKLQLNAIR